TGEPGLVYGIFIALIIIPFLTLLTGMAGIRLWGLVAKIPTKHLWPIVLVLSVIGSYAMRANVFDVYVMITAGVVGYLFMKGNFPLVPLVMGLIVGPIAETGFRRATIINGGSYSWLMEPIPLVLISLGFLTVAISIVRTVQKR